MSKKKFFKNLSSILLCICLFGSGLLNFSYVKAESPEVYNYKLNSKETDSLNNDSVRYKFKLNNKQKITFTVSASDMLEFSLFNYSGEIMSKICDHEKNTITDKYTYKMIRTLNKGTYYIDISPDSYYDDQNIKYTFKAVKSKVSKNTEFGFLNQGSNTRFDRYKVTIKKTKTLNIKVSANDDYELIIYKKSGKRLKTYTEPKYNEIYKNYKFNVKKKLNKGTYYIAIDGYGGSDLQYTLTYK